MTRTFLSPRFFSLLALLSMSSLALTGCDFLEQFEEELAIPEQTEAAEPGAPAGDDHDEGDCDSPGENDQSDGGADENDEGDSSSDGDASDPLTPLPSNCEGGPAPLQMTTLRTREEARAFGEAYTSADTVFIEGLELTDLDDLVCLDEIRSLVVSDTVLERAELPFVTSVGSVLFEDNVNLRLISMPRVESMGHLDVLRNPRLVRVRIAAATEIDRRVNIEENQELRLVDLSSTELVSHFTVADNPSLRSLEVANVEEAYSVVITGNRLAGTVDLSSLRTVTAGLRVEANEELTEVHLDSLQSVNEGLVWAQGLAFTGNPSLEQLQMPFLTVVNGHFTIGANDRLSRVEVVRMEHIGIPFTPCERACMRGWLGISDNPQLTELTFPALVAVARNITVINNDSLENLDGFPSLQIVRSVLRVSDNDSLQDISGLFALESVGSWASPVGPDRGGYRIHDNSSLPIEQAEHLAYNIIGENNIGGGGIFIR
mgnify:CR=1 FL=1